MDGQTDERGPALDVKALEDGLRAARRTSQKRAKRIYWLKAKVGELEAVRAEDERLLHYLLSDAFESRGPWVTGVGGSTAGPPATRAPG